MRSTLIVTLFTLVFGFGCGKKSPPPDVTQDIGKDTMYVAKFEENFGNFKAKATIRATFIANYSPKEGLAPVFPLYFCSEATDVESQNPLEDGYVSFRIYNKCDEPQRLQVFTELSKAVKTKSIGNVTRPFIVVDHDVVTVSPCYMGLSGECDASVRLTPTSEPELWQIYRQAMDLASKADKVLYQGDKRTYEFNRLQQK